LFLDALQLGAACSARGLRTQIHVPDSGVDTASLLQTSFHPLAVIVDLQCDRSSQLMRMVFIESTSRFIILLKPGIGLSNRLDSISTSQETFFLITFYLQAVHVHLANGVTLRKA
jgi:hypothetical protein